MEKVTRRAMELAVCYGASAVGVATLKTLEGGPPSTDLTYVLPNARSAISFAVPLNQEPIEAWFRKKSHEQHFKDNIQTNVIASGVSLELASSSVIPIKKFAKPAIKCWLKAALSFKIRMDHWKRLRRKRAGSGLKQWMWKPGHFTNQFDAILTGYKKSNHKHQITNNIQ